MTTAQAIDGYGCSCGFKSDTRQKFIGHIRVGQLREGKEAHQSLGRVNLLTGEVTMPPFKHRNAEQLYETKYGRKPPPTSILADFAAKDILTEPPPKTPTTKNKEGKSEKAATVSGTEILSQATQLRFIPRVFTTNLTPIMLLGYEVAIRKWGWRSDMPFENYLDTIIFNYTLEHGTQLQGAVTIFDEDEHDNGQEPESEEK